MPRRARELAETLLARAMLNRHKNREESLRCASRAVKVALEGDTALVAEVHEKLLNLGFTVVAGRISLPR